ncbi:rRNA maturation RNase YbeY [Bartonella sp. TP]|uniref:rRNA maturation RNase YbeY n=1 Tax=Bartonella sp. TP TaxID=3057550 RepID=UPI0025B0EE0B|nr:rRNA maturation RNase YbeY [Bartonella sp. TP]MDN5248568.1 rRNA maturation RNase YbeY [Alphaproteobacteria bacterium]WJW80390.1 rRNA maturation RNase YbeY [Bartonella sp. TP]
MIEIDLSRLSTLWPSHTELSAFCNMLLTPISTSLIYYYPNWETIQSELSLVFTDNEHITKLNSNWRGVDKATNVLSFPAYDLKIGEAPSPILGDIIFAFETIKEQAITQHKPFEHHLSHLFIHGFLHLLGFDHETEEQSDKMEPLECEILAKLHIPNPYILPENA